MKKPKEKFYRNMLTINYVVTSKLSKDYPLFMELRITKIDVNKQDLRTAQKTFHATKNRILNIFNSFRGSVNKGKLKEVIPRTVQLTLSQAFSGDKVKGKEENKLISFGEVNTPLDYFDKYVRIRTPQLKEKEITYTNQMIEQFAERKNMRVDNKGRLFIGKGGLRKCGK